ncbi:MAG: outer-membrane lipoprotein carrier protein LolA [Muribaculaceae bacterium]|nr:outer-membrane lipoprotein carrier protein LolA [Muribaculaceae bacterium]
MPNHFRHITLLLAAIILGSLPLAAQKSDAVATVRKAADKILSAPSVTVSLTLSNGSEKQSATLVMMRDAFTITAPSYRSWFDGRTQWTLFDETGEVNMTTPTASEIAESNPFTILSTLSSHYSLSPAPAPAGCSKVSLRPLKSSAPFSSATITVNNSTLLPVSLTAVTSDGQTISVTVSKVTFGQKLPISTFRFNQRDFPGVDIIDLR